MFFYIVSADSVRAILKTDPKTLLCAFRTSHAAISTFTSIRVILVPACLGGARSRLSALLLLLFVLLLLLLKQLLLLPCLLRRHLWLCRL